jgi:putative transposase
MYLGMKVRMYPNKLQAGVISQILSSSRKYYNQVLDSYSKKGEGIKNQKLLSQAADFPDTSIPRFLEFSARQAARDKNQRHKGENDSFQSFSFLCRNHSLVLSRNPERVSIPFLGEVPVRGLRSLSGSLCSATIRREQNDRFFLSMRIASLNDKKMVPNRKAVGIDLGITDFAVLSSGERIPNMRFYEQEEGAIAFLQKELGKHHYGSRRYLKVRNRLARKEERIAARRLNFLHKATSAIVEEYQYIFAESLPVQEMEKERKYAKSISHAGWAEFYRQLEYKSKMKGRIFHQIPRLFPSSQICHSCGALNPESKDTRNREIHCHGCNNTYDRDLNAALNIRDEGLKEIGVPLI